MKQKMILTRVSQCQTQLPALDTSSTLELADIGFSTSHQVSTDDYLADIFKRLWEKLFPSQGSLLLDQDGQLRLSTPKALEFCRVIHRSVKSPCLGNVSQNTDFLMPSCIITLCKLLIKSLAEFPTQTLLLQEEILSKNGQCIHLKAEWIQLEMNTPKYILVTLEDMTQVAHKRSLCDAYRYHLTSREMEVWELYLQGLPYREIGSRLFIATSTVKKHMKNIYGKRRSELA